MKKKLKKLKVVLHPLFLFFGIVMLIIGRGREFIICTFSAFCHEWAHSLVADKYGYRMERIRLMPFGAELHGDTDSFVGKDEIYIAIAGPLLNFIICTIILGWWWLFPSSYGSTIEIFETNLVMGIFNLLPFFPLDGGRVLLALLSIRFNRKTGAKIVKKTTIVFAVTLFIGFIISCFYKPNFTLGVLGFMMFFTSSTSHRDAVYEKLSMTQMAGTRKVKWTIMSVPRDMPIYELRRLHSKNQITIFKVMNKNGEEEFYFSELDLEKAIIKIKPDEIVGNIKDLL